MFVHIWSAHCSVCTGQYTMYSIRLCYLHCVNIDFVHIILCALHCAIHNVDCTLCCLHCLTAQCTFCNIAMPQCAVCGVWLHCSLYKQYAMCIVCILSAHYLHTVQYAMSLSAQCAASVASVTLLRAVGQLGGGWEVGGGWEELNAELARPQPHPLPIYVTFTRSLFSPHFHCTKAGSYMSR